MEERGPFRGLPRGAGRLQIDAAVGGFRVTLVGNERENGKPVGALPDGEPMFHDDSTFLERTLMETTLHGWKIPSTGGDTLFANTRLAQESPMSGPLRYSTQARTGAFDRKTAPHAVRPAIRARAGAVLQPPDDGRTGRPAAPGERGAARCLFRPGPGMSTDMSGARATSFCSTIAAHSMRARIFQRMNAASAPRRGDHPVRCAAAESEFGHAPRIPLNRSRSFQRKGLSWPFRSEPGGSRSRRRQGWRASERRHPQFGIQTSGRSRRGSTAAARPNRPCLGRRSSCKMRPSSRMARTVRPRFVSRDPRQTPRATNR